MDFKLPGEFEYRDVVYASANKGVDIDMLQWWSAEPSDIVIASYPKTGTTWLTGLVPLVLEDGDEASVDARGHMGLNVPYIEMSFHSLPTYKDVIQQNPAPHVLKTHLRSEFLNKQIEQDGAKIIMVFRNPKDTIVSFYHFYRINEVVGYFSGTFHEFFELIKKGRVLFGCLFKWYADWWSKRDRPNVLALKYEDLIKDGHAQVKKIAKFCGRNLNDETIQKIVASCHIDKMRAKPTTSMNAPHGPVDSAKGSFYRKGGIGDWRNHLSDEESQWVDEQCAKYLTPIGLTFDYE